MQEIWLRNNAFLNDKSEERQGFISKRWNLPTRFLGQEFYKPSVGSLKNMQIDQQPRNTFG